MTPGITDINGRLIKSAIIAGFRTQIDVAGLPSGVYIMKVTDNNGIIVKRLVEE